MEDGGAAVRSVVRVRRPVGGDALARGRRTPIDGHGLHRGGTAWLDDARTCLRQALDWLLCDGLAALARPEGLDALAARKGHHGRVSLRWILTHLIEEEARHLGHADLLREAIDGAVGD